MSEEYKQKAKQFLEKQLIEFKRKIKKLKRKRKLVKAIYANLIVISVTSSMLCATLSGLLFFPIPLLIIPSLNIIAGLCSALSVKFNLEGKKSELKETIDQLNKTQRQIDYVVSCNGNFSEAEYKEIMKKLNL